MKTETLLTLAALAGAAALVLLAPRAAKAVMSTSGAPKFGGSAGTVWDDAKTASYRAQLTRELSAAGDFWI